MNVQFNSASENGTMEKLFPVSKAKNILVDPVGNNVPDTAENMEDVINELGTLAFQDSIDIPVASTEVYGLTKLSSETNDETANDTAATTAALSKVAAQCISKDAENQKIDGELAVESLTVGNAKLTTSTDQESGDKVLTVDLL